MSLSSEGWAWGECSKRWVPASLELQWLSWYRKAAWRGKSRTVLRLGDGMEPACQWCPCITAGKSSGEGKPGDLVVNISTVEGQAELLLLASLLQSRWGCQPHIRAPLRFVLQLQRNQLAQVSHTHMRGSPERLYSLSAESMAAAEACSAAEVPLWPWAAQDFTLLLGNSFHLHY